MIRLIHSLLLFSFLTVQAFAEETKEKTAVLYKSPSCSCCEGYARYLKKNGFNVEVKATKDLDNISRKAGIPEDFQGCHTTFIDGYVIGGHVPVKTVNKMLSERPKIKGITLPGMPAGSPGMGGEKDEPWQIYSVGEGEPKVYATE